MNFKVLCNQLANLVQCLVKLLDVHYVPLQQFPFHLLLGASLQLHDSRQTNVNHQNVPLMLINKFLSFNLVSSHPLLPL